MRHRETAVTHLFCQEDHQGDGQEIGQRHLDDEHEEQVGSDLAQVWPPTRPVRPPQLVQGHERGASEHRYVCGSGDMHRLGSQSDVHTEAAGDHRRV